MQKYSPVGGLPTTSVLRFTHVSPVVLIKSARIGWCARRNGSIRRRLSVPMRSFSPARATSSMAAHLRFPNSLNSTGTRLTESAMSCYFAVCALALLVVRRTSPIRQQLVTNWANRGHCRIGTNNHHCRAAHSTTSLTHTPNSLKNSRLSH